MVDESESIHIVIPQAAPGSKSSTGRQKRPINDRASRLRCGRISAGSGTKEHRKNGGPGHGNYLNHYIMRPDDRNNQGTCLGDSGGPSGEWHWLGASFVFAVHGVHSGIQCGHYRDSAGNPLWYSYNNRPQYHSVWIQKTVPTCRQVAAADGTMLQCWSKADGS